MNKASNTPRMKRTRTKHLKCVRDNWKRQRTEKQRRKLKKTAVIKRIYNKLQHSKEALK